MTDKFISELLILILLFVVNIRVVLKIKDNRDVLVVLAPTALLLSIISFFAWNITISGIVIFFLAFFVCVINLHSFGRFLSNLVTDFYSPLLCIFSILNCFVILFVAIFLFIMRPVSNPLDDLNVVEDIKFLTGSYTRGFNEKQLFSDTIDGKIYLYKHKDDLEKENCDKPLILMVLDPRESCDSMKSVASQISSYGYEVLVADFSKSIFSQIYWSFQDSFGKKFEEEKNYLENVLVAQYGSLLKLYGKKAKENGRKIFLVGDGLNKNVFSKIKSLYSNVVDVDGFFVINGINSVGETVFLSDWVDGYGVIMESDPVFAWIKNCGKFFECRDSTRFYSIAAAVQIDSFIKKIISNETVLKN